MVDLYTSTGTMSAHNAGRNKASTDGRGEKSKQVWTEGYYLGPSTDANHGSTTKSTIPMDSFPCRAKERVESHDGLLGEKSTGARHNQPSGGRPSNWWSAALLCMLDLKICSCTSFRGKWLCSLQRQLLLPLPLLESCCYILLPFLYVAALDQIRVTRYGMNVHGLKNEVDESCRDNQITTTK